MANVADTVRHFKKQGFLTMTDLESQLLHAKPAARRAALDKLPAPGVVVNHISLWSPQAYQPILDGACPRRKFNAMARDFIMGKFRPVKAAKRVRH